MIDDNYILRCVEDVYIRLENRKFYPLGEGAVFRIGSQDFIVKIPCYYSLNLIDKTMKASDPFSSDSDFWDEIDAPQLLTSKSPDKE